MEAYAFCVVSPATKRKEGVVPVNSVDYEVAYRGNRATSSKGEPRGPVIASADEALRQTRGRLIQSKGLVEAYANTGRLIQPEGLVEAYAAGRRIQPEGLVEAYA